jgi:hypothetical protein
VVRVLAAFDWVPLRFFALAAVGWPVMVLEGGRRSECVRGRSCVSLSWSSFPDRL